MSLSLIKKNSSSPFHLQRSIVDQGGAGGAYESGGFNPNAVYNNDAANAAIISFGKVVGAGLAAADIKSKKFKKPELPKDDGAAAAATFEDYKKDQETKKQNDFEKSVVDKIKFAKSGEQPDTIGKREESIGWNKPKYWFQQ